MSDRGFRVRPATPADAGEVVRLVRALAAYEREPASSVRVTEGDLRRDAFGDAPRCEILVAEAAEAEGAAAEAAVVGFALCFPNYSTWEGRAGIHVEDLFVEERYRGRGIGRALLAAVARRARERGCARIDLSVLDWNAPARGVYERLGMRAMADWIPYRMERAEIDALADEG